MWARAAGHPPLRRVFCCLQRACSRLALYPPASSTHGGWCSVTWTATACRMQWWQVRSSRPIARTRCVSISEAIFTPSPRSPRRLLWDILVQADGNLVQLPDHRVVLHGDVLRRVHAGTGVGARGLLSRGRVLWLPTAALRFFCRTWGLKSLGCRSYWHRWEDSSGCSLAFLAGRRAQLAAPMCLLRLWRLSCKRAMPLLARTHCRT
jgi:hypothetical protein